MLSISGAQLVLWLHIVAATVWIGGQLTVAMVIPVVRGHGALPTVVGQRYQLIAWPAFAVLVITGILNVGNAGLQWSSLLDSAGGRTLVIKLGLVALSGVSAAIHAFVQAPRHDRAAPGRPVAAAVLGSISLLSAVAAALYGVLIATG